MIVHQQTALACSYARAGGSSPRWPWSALIAEEATNAQRKLGVWNTMSSGPGLAALEDPAPGVLNVGFAAGAGFFAGPIRSETVGWEVNANSQTCSVKGF